jgi:hypothetical protein
MTVIDDFKSDKNRNLIIQASNKMLADKYKLSLNTDILINIINSIITSMSKDAILMNNTIKLMELNTITLAKMKEYVNKNIDSINTANNNITDNPLLANNNNNPPVENTGNNVDLNNEEYNSKKEITNEELLIRVKDYENNRLISNSVFVNIENDIEATSRNNTDTNMNVIPEIIEKVLTTINSNINTNINKKTLIINSYSRDWIINPHRNTLSFTINIDLQNNVIEPLKILFPLYVKNITPYIILVITVQRCGLID